MMSKIAIEVEGLSKAYQLGQFNTGALTQDLKRWWAISRGKEDPFLKIGEPNDRAIQGKSNIVWSLKDISFSVEQGDAVGIIGRNGAGKSTLLKLLSRVTSPTTGEIRINGRIASLLEVGTGFHPELTGRENIFLNGAILGMRKREIARKFDEIVDFAGVERYIDTPVKRYSSGMYVRLAFAVAAHLDSEILIVDEVLAVGDSEFQKKCLGKMGEVSSGQGRTVLFVSHNMAAVKQLCNKGIVLKNGQVAYEGHVLEAVNVYQSSNGGNSYFQHTGSFETAPGNDSIRIFRFCVKPLYGEHLSISSGVEFELEFFSSKERSTIDVTFELKNGEEVPVLHQGTLLSNDKSSERGVYSVMGTLPAHLLNSGTYRFTLIFGENQRHVLFRVEDFVQFEILNEAVGSNHSILPGVIRPQIPYRIAFKPWQNGI